MSQEHQAESPTLGYAPPIMVGLTVTEEPDGTLVITSRQKPKILRTLFHGLWMPVVSFAVATPLLLGVMILVASILLRYSPIAAAHQLIGRWFGQWPIAVKKLAPILFFWIGAFELGAILFILSVSRSQVRLAKSKTVARNRLQATQILSPDSVRAIKIYARRVRFVLRAQRGARVIAVASRDDAIAVRKIIASYWNVSIDERSGRIIR